MSDNRQNDPAPKNTYELHRRLLEVSRNCANAPVEEKVEAVRQAIEMYAAFYVHDSESTAHAIS
jgi:hypothetical protein